MEDNRDIKPNHNFYLKTSILHSENPVTDRVNEEQMAEPEREATTAIANNTVHRATGFPDNPLLPEREARQLELFKDENVKLHYRT
jgi:hypothetical protein